MVVPPLRTRASSSALQQRRDSLFSPRPASSFGINKDTMNGAGASGSGGASSSAGSSNSTSVQVAVRIRPLTEHDQTSIPTRWQRSVVQPAASNAVSVDASGQPPPGQAVVSGAAKKHAFTFDRVHGPDDGQEQIYAQTVQPLISRFLEGYNVTVLAYGQTSSGKSYTMGTSLADVDFEGLVAGQAPDPQTGIIPRAVARIFADMRQLQLRAGNNIQFQAKASFIEIYNEELIDLLATEDGDSRPLVQIREDKAGHIYWSGLREVRVQSVADVMNYLLQGSAVRRTHETDMNAQSSRSHAIFSLTLVQRKLNSSNMPTSPMSGPPPAYSQRGSLMGGNSGRATPTGRSTPTGRTGLPRPTSTAPGTSSRASMIGRPNTPGRASTSLGMAEDRNGDAGEWVTVTSKFHFVDLAGSERLKRTAAQGERVREGISINAGLHALGNVISALGDPAKSRRVTHIPYRDSKLTRLLQDSLGGNAFTCMIACVSPTEYNVSETVNTLQYANRARNIKNKAELNQVEIGWDDVDYLQTQVLKLRKELQILRGFKAGSAGGDAAFKVMDQKDTLEWQSRYAALSQKYTTLTTEVTQLRQNVGSNVSNDDYYKAAEPIIIEYEKTVDALEGQINLMKAALGHSEDVIMAQEQALYDGDAKIATLENDLQVRESNMTALQERLVKLEQRETSTDSYVRELEARLSARVKNGEMDSQGANEVRKELSRLRDIGNAREQYIKDLENRLASSEESIASLQAGLAAAEQDVERREAAYVEVQRRMEAFDSSDEQRAMLRELDERERRVLDLEAKVDSMQNDKESIVRERGKLADTLAQQQVEKGKLEDTLRELKAAAMAATVNGASSSTPSSVAASLPSQLSTSSRLTAPAGSQHEEDVSFLQTQVEMLSEELKSKDEAGSSTRNELETLNEKYKEALAEIKDLTQQLSETNQREGGRPLLLRKLSTQSLASGTQRIRPEPLALDSSAPRRKPTSRRNSGSFLGYNPRESTPRDGVPLPQLPQTAIPMVSEARGNNVPSSEAASLMQPSSSQSSALPSHSGLPRRLSLSGSADSAKMDFALLTAGSAPSEQSPSPLTGGHGAPSSPIDLSRKVASLEAETMRLQEALRERDEEIAALERRSHGHSGSTDAATTVDDVHKESNGLSASERPRSREIDELMRAMARKEVEAQQEIQDLKEALKKQQRTQRDTTSIGSGSFVNQALTLADETPTPESGDSGDVQQPSESASGSRGADVSFLRIDGRNSEYEAKVTKEHEEAIANLNTEHMTALNSLQKGHDDVVMQLKSDLIDAKSNHAKAVSAHEAELATHQRDYENLQQTHVHALEQLEALKTAHSEYLRLTSQQHQAQMNELSKSLQDAVSTRDAIASAHEDLTSKYEGVTAHDPEDAMALRAELNETSDALVTLEGALTEAQEQRDQALRELEGLKQDAGASSHAQAAKQAQKSADALQNTLANTRSELQRVKSDLQGMMEDKTRQDSLLREMQTKVAIAETRSASTQRAAQAEAMTSADSAISSPRSPQTPQTPRRSGQDGRASSSGFKQPPFSPPPNMPPPPTPGTAPGTPTQARHGNAMRATASSSSLAQSRADSPTNGMHRISRTSSANSIASNIHASGIATSDEKTAKLLAEQADEIKNLAHQLNYCEQDLQANIDLVATLEAALADSERNLRKSRVQLSEAARERDRYATQIDDLQQQVSQAQHEADNVRNSVMLEKQGYESQLQHEREAKERARRALEARLEEVHKKKNSRLFCM